MPPQCVTAKNVMQMGNYLKIIITMELLYTKPSKLGTGELMLNKQKGWPQCEKCDQWKENKCRAVNEEGLSPCEVMSRKVFNYLVKQED